MARKFGVGIIGLTPGRSWAAIAHIPALRALSDDYDIVGVANSSEASAKAAAEATGLPRAFRSVAELCASPDVDVVAVNVKVPQHRALVTTALDAKKHVYCEWPLGNGLAEARELAAMAKKAGVLAVCGTQARGSNDFAHVRKLMVDGYVGRLLSVTLVGTGGIGGPQVGPTSTYSLDKKNGAHLLTIPLGHTLAVLRDIVGPIVEVSARLATRYTQASVMGTNDVLPKTSYDQVLVNGLLQEGAPISIHYRGGGMPGTALLLEILGEDGVIQVTGPTGHSQYCPLTIKGARTGEAALTALLPGPRLKEGWREAYAPDNVRHIYARLAQDLRTGSSTAPTFEEAVEIHEVIAAIEKANESGGRVTVRSV